jgi:nucleoside-diphosphate-sugar epimerase
MHILLTGAAGSLGSHTLLYLLQRGHTVLALDRTSLADATLAQIASLPETVRSGYTFQKADLADYEAFEQLVKNAEPAVQGVIHLGAIPQPLGLDARFVHNNNVVSSYNVLYTCAKLGITRIAQASSVNAPGLSYSPEGHHVFYQLPVTETTPLLPVGGPSFLT